MMKKYYKEKTVISEDPVIKYELTASMMNLSSTKTSLSSLGISREMVRIENGTSGFEMQNNCHGGESEMVCGRAGVRHIRETLTEDLKVNNGAAT